MICGGVVGEIIEFHVAFWTGIAIPLHPFKKCYYRINSSHEHHPQPSLYISFQLHGDLIAAGARAREMNKNRFVSCPLFCLCLHCWCLALLVIVLKHEQATFLVVVVILHDFAASEVWHYFLANWNLLTQVFTINSSKFAYCFCCWAILQAFTRNWFPFRIQLKWIEQWKWPCIT